MKPVIGNARPHRFLTVAALVAGLGLLTGGCPDVRNGVLDAVESATVDVLSDRTTTGTAVDLQNDLVRTFVGLFFEELRIERVQ